MLLINRNRAVATDSLVDAAWEQSPPPAARASIHSYVSKLRRLVTDAEVDRHRCSQRTTGVSTQRRRRRLRPRPLHHQKDRGNSSGRRRPIRRGQQPPVSRAVRMARAGTEDLRDFAFVDAFATALTEDKVWPSPRGPKPR